MQKKEMPTVLSDRCIIQYQQQWSQLSLKNLYSILCPYLCLGIRSLHVRWLQTLYTASVEQTVLFGDKHTQSILKIFFEDVTRLGCNHKTKRESMVNSLPHLFIFGNFRQRSKLEEFKPEVGTTRHRPGLICTTHFNFLSYFYLAFRVRFRSYTIPPYSIYLMLLLIIILVYFYS